MNILQGNIREITTENEISLVKIDALGQVFTSIVIDTPDGSDYLKIGHPVRLLFKETEVILARTSPLAISVQNRIECVIREITAGRLLCNLTLDILGHPQISRNPSTPEDPASPAQIQSIITRNACDQLSLQTGDKITALIKTNEVSLSPHD
jgi:molybdopterin-binding protein